MDNDREIWKHIIGYDYNYMISNHGRFMNTNPFHKRLKNIPKTGSFDSKGYLITSLVKDGKSIDKKVHRLVAKYFLYNYCESLQVNHKDLNKSNNNVLNLEMSTPKSNVRHFHSNVTIGNTSSERIGVNYHKAIKKWVSRVSIDGKRYSLGTFDSEIEAIDCLNRYEIDGVGVINKGKGKLNKGKRKYSNDDIDKILEHHKKFGVRRTVKELNVGTSTLYSFIKGTYNNER